MLRSLLCVLLCGASAAVTLGVGRFVQAEDGRGQSMAGVLLIGDSLEETQSVIYGTLANGEQHEARLPMLGGLPHAGDRYVGTELNDGWWVKARLVVPDTNGQTRYRCCRGDGRKVEYKDMTEEELSKVDLTM